MDRMFQLVLILGFLLRQTFVQAGCSDTCHKYARCADWLPDEHCVCKPGYHGDGVNYCARVCQCSISANNHYTTYDGKMLHFKGACSYLLTKSVVTSDACAFAISIKHSKNEKEKSQLNRIEISLMEENIAFLRGGRVLVNGLRRFVPVDLNSRNIQVLASGVGVQLQSRCGLYVRYDGDSSLQVSIPSRYSQRVVGLCGDCNSVTNDDMRFMNGTYIPAKLPHAVHHMANSYVIDESCEAEEFRDFGFCTPDVLSRVNGLNYCGMITNKDGAFGMCVRGGEVDVAAFYDSCKMDVCSDKLTEKEFQRSMCLSLTGFAEACAYRGFPAHWRGDTKCAVTCGPHQRYRSTMTACPEMCSANNSLLGCSLPPTEGCACEPGYVLSGGACVKPDDCGCTDSNDRYYPIGASQMSEDCLASYTCQAGYRAPYMRITSWHHRCHYNGKCAPNADGDLGCICADGYDGDGVDSCKPAECSKCHKNANCALIAGKYKCICRYGFIGDGVHVCGESCLCSASGDPHYKTYDGRMMHFQGACTYTLSRSTIMNDPCAFNVVARNEHRFGNMFMSYTRSISMEIYGFVIDMLQDRVVKVNNERIDFPFTDHNGDLRIFVSGRGVQIILSCGVRASFDGITAIIMVPKMFAGHMDGICGDCDGLPDNDLRLKNGTSVFGHANANSLVGHSYLVSREGETDSKCKVEEFHPYCEPELEAMIGTPYYCGMITDTEGPFASCIASGIVDVNNYYESCKMDVCSFEGEPKNMDAVVCASIDGFSQDCAAEGYATSWRTPDFCGMKCGEHEIYRAAASACPDTCAELDSAQKCDLPDAEGCECVEDFVLSGTKCVRKSECGCLDSSGHYYTVGKRKSDEGCGATYECVNRNGTAFFRQVFEPQICYENADCRVKSDGQKECVCNDGYEGDGYTYCYKKVKAPLETTVPFMEWGDIGDDNDNDDNDVANNVLDAIAAEKTIRTTASRGLETTGGPRHTTETPEKDDDIPLAAFVPSAEDQQKEATEKPVKTTTRTTTTTTTITTTTKTTTAPTTVITTTTAARPTTEEIIDHRPLCTGTRCAINARCRNGHCVCEKPNYGDGHHVCEPDVCVCVGFGDPHIEMFDGQKINLLGSCTFEVTRYTDDDCGFSIRVRASKRYYSKDALHTFADFVDLITAKSMVRIDRGFKAEVNGSVVNLPYITQDGIVLTTSVDREYVEAVTSCGVRLLYNGVHIFAVSVPRNLMTENLEGVCGNCDNKQNDIHTRTGKTIEEFDDEDAAYVELSKSYVVHGFDDEGCDI